MPHCFIHPQKSKQNERSGTACCSALDSAQLQGAQGTPYGEACKVGIYCTLEVWLAR